MKRSRKDWNKALCMLLATILLISPFSTVSNAWLQPAHRSINQAAVTQFRSISANAPKYRNAGVSLDQFIEAPIVYSTGKFSITYNQRWSMDSVASHIVEGGYSADEPNVYVSMKHFYDPLSLSGRPELTDQSSVHGKVYEAVPATEWALTRADNPYSLHNAMLYYKKSMEIPSDAPVAALPTNGDFRDFAGAPGDLDQMRSMYLGKAMRGLGETMHLVADMTQPAHVRNDSHPGWEVTEDAVTGASASALTKYTRVDGLVGLPLGNQVRDIMQTLSTYVNARFYSEDTIADAASGVLPRNGETPYANPNFSLFTAKTELGDMIYSQNFGGKRIPMLRKEPGTLYGYNHVIPVEYVLRQGEVLFPLAAAATARTMDLFFPTFSLQTQVQPVAVDAAMLDKAKAAGAEDLRQYEAAIRLEHVVARDPQWTAEGLRIEYSGPGAIWRVRNGRHEKLAEVEFVKGVVVSYQDPETGEQTGGNPVFYMPIGAEKAISMTGPVVDYTVEMGDSLYATVAAGARILSSDAFTFDVEDPVIRLTADRSRLMPGEAVVFKAELENPPERYKLEWSFGDEDMEEGVPKAPIQNRRLEMKHVYEKSGTSTATVRVIDLKRKVVRASASTTVSSDLGEMAGTWDLVLQVQEENQFFRAMLIGLMKILIQGIISPLAEALGGSPVDPSAAEKFTLVGTLLTYSLDLARQGEGEPAVYAGPLTFVGSSTSGIEGTQEIRSLRMEMRNGVMVFVAEAVSEQGVPVSFVFLKDGRMTSPGNLEGQFDIPGFMGGTWTAVRR